jgi:hypothetical protein
MTYVSVHPMGSPVCETRSEGPSLSQAFVNAVGSAILSLWARNF